MKDPKITKVVEAIIKHLGASDDNVVWCDRQELGRELIQQAINDFDQRGFYLVGQIGTNIVFKRKEKKK